MGKVAQYGFLLVTVVAACPGGAVAEEFAIASSGLLPMEQLLAADQPEGASGSQRARVAYPPDTHRLRAPVTPGERRDLIFNLFEHKSTTPPPAVEEREPVAPALSQGAEASVSTPDNSGVSTPAAHAEPETRPETPPLARSGAKARTLRDYPLIGRPVSRPPAVEPMAQPATEEARPSEPMIPEPLPVGGASSDIVAGAVQPPVDVLRETAPASGPESSSGLESSFKPESVSDADGEVPSATAADDSALSAVAEGAGMAKPRLFRQHPPIRRPAPQERRPAPRPEPENPTVSVVPQLPTETPTPEAVGSAADRAVDVSAHSGSRTEAGGEGLARVEERPFLMRAEITLEDAAASVNPSLADAPRAAPAVKMDPFPSMEDFSDGGDAVSTEERRGATVLFRRSNPAYADVLVAPGTRDREERLLGGKNPASGHGSHEAASLGKPAVPLSVEPGSGMDGSASLEPPRAADRTAAHVAAYAEYGDFLPAEAVTAIPDAWATQERDALSARAEASPESGGEALAKAFSAPDMPAVSAPRVETPRDMPGGMSEPVAGAISGEMPASGGTLVDAPLEVGGDGAIAVAVDSAPDAAVPEALPGTVPEAAAVPEMAAVLPDVVLPHTDPEPAPLVDAPAPAHAREEAAPSVVPAEAVAERVFPETVPEIPAAPARGARPIARILPPAPLPESVWIGEPVLGAIRPGERLLIGIAFEPDTLREVVVGADGRLAYTHGIRMTVSGLTPPQVAAMLHDRMRLYLAQPAVTVERVFRVGGTVTVVGDVRRQGPFVLGESTALLDMLTLFGWTDAGAPELMTERACLVRDGVVLPLALDRLLRDRDRRASLPLRDGDVLLLPTRGGLSAGVPVFGAVRQGGFYRGGGVLTLRGAVEAAGAPSGSPSSAAGRRVAIIRGVLTEPRVIRADAGRIAAGEEPDIRLEAHDLVFIAEDFPSGDGELLRAALAALGAFSGTDL